MKQIVRKQNPAEVSEGQLLFLLGTAVRVQAIEYDEDGTTEVDNIVSYGPFRAYSTSETESVITLLEGTVFRWDPTSDRVIVTISWLEPEGLNPEFV